nr:hypothetical protein [Martellivirales sp.]
MSQTSVNYGEDFVAVHPDDSASKRGSESDSTTRSLVVVEPPAANLVDFSTITDPDVAKAALAYAADYYSAYRDYCKTMHVGCDTVRSEAAADGTVQKREVDSVSSVQSGASGGSGRSVRSSASSVRSGLTRLSARSIRSAGRAAAWKEKQMPDVLPRGLCYARMLRPNAAESVTMALGFWPTVGEILNQPAEAFLPLFATEHFVVTESDDGLHVDAGCDGLSLNSVFLKSARREVYNNKFGSYGHMLARSRVPSGTDRRLASIDRSCRVGGGPRVYGYPSDVRAPLVRSRPVVESRVCSSFSAKERAFEAFESVRGDARVGCVVESVDLELPSVIRDPKFAELDIPCGTSLSLRSGVIGDGVVSSMLLPPSVTVVSHGRKLVGARDRYCVFVCPASVAVSVFVPYGCDDTRVPLMHSSASWLIRSRYCYGLADAVDVADARSGRSGTFCFSCRAFHRGDYECRDLARVAGLDV